MRTTRILISIILGVIAAASMLWISAQAAEKSITPAMVTGTTYTVCSSGCDYNNIQNAILAVASEDTLELSCETFTEYVVINKSVNILGCGVDQTIIQAANSQSEATHPVIQVNAGVTTTLDGLTIRYGNFSGSGGGIQNSGNLTLLNSALISNTATSGGGMMIGSDHTFLSNVAFIDNSATTGGGIFINSTDPILSNVILHGNVASSEGGGVYISSNSSPTLLNVLLVGNFAGNAGGGINSFTDSHANLINLTVAYNRAGNFGGGLFNYNTSPTITNVILWENEAPTGSQIFNGTSGSPLISHSDIQGCGDSTSWISTCGSNGGGNIDENPAFMRNPDPGDGDWSTKGDNDYGDLHVNLTSPVIDAGTNSGCPAVDLDGISRPVGANCDIGAYEKTITETWVDDDWASQADVDNFNPVLVWQGDAFNSVDQAVGVVTDGTVHVLTGTYTETLTLNNSVEIIGEAGPKNTTIKAAGFPGGGNSRVITVTAGTTITLKGLTIAYGLDVNGGGIYNMGVLTISQCYLVNNQATNDGGAIYNGSTSASASLSIQQTTIAYNSASRYGAGLFNLGASNSALVTVENSTFTHNSAEDGGAIGNVGALTHLAITHTTFSGNSASASGGGGAMRNLNGIVTLTANILADSSADFDCVSNTVVNDNGYNLVEDGSCGFPDGGDPELGTLSDNGGPIFTQAPSQGSPVIDAIPYGSCTLTTDQRGVVRPQGAGCEIGAYELITNWQVFLPILLKMP